MPSTVPWRGAPCSTPSLVNERPGGKVPAATRQVYGLDPPAAPSGS
ncbi:MAG: hypothetical protein MUC96_38105 [Myxococcaceae bacterium]|nr:hypothetical protein [Myxococcaceae bacterium]